MVALAAVVATGLTGTIGINGADAAETLTRRARNPASRERCCRASVRCGSSTPTPDKYNEVAGDASAPYVPNLRKPGKPLTFAFAEGWAAIPFSVSINKGIYKIAGRSRHRHHLLRPGVQTGEGGNLRRAALAAAPRLRDRLQLAIGRGRGDHEDLRRSQDSRSSNIDVWHPNGIFFGADNYVSGEIGGKAAGEYAKSLDKCGDVTIFNGINPGEGDAAAQRMAGFTDGVQEICGAIPADRILSEIFDAGTTEQALTKTTDWLTAHPGAGFVLSTSIDDARSAGISKALAQNEREGAAVGLGCDEIGVAATKEGDPAKTRFLGCVAYFPEKYPDYVMSIGLDVLDGKPVPDEVHIEHKFLDKDTVGSVYP